jgi:glutamate synthase (NADPH/NADH) large chain
VALVDKNGDSTHANIMQSIDALCKMGHRSGDINGEGDGCGITTDIPREIWARRLGEIGLSPFLAESFSFFVGHFFLPASVRAQSKNITRRLRELFRRHEIELLMELSGATRDLELGPRARADAPLFWQFAALIPDTNRTASSRRLFKLQLEIEERLPEVHIASLSLDSVIFKLQGVPELLPLVFPELLDEEMRSVITLGHNRYSTNTLPTVMRSQPFSLLGHNGEINTIDRLRQVGRVLGIRPLADGSDSQDLNRVIEGLIHLHGLDLIEAMELVFPPVYSEVEDYPKELRELFAFYRWFFPCSAQGPAAVVARYGDLCLGSVDALGLRPLWFGESDYNYFFSSEKGVVDLAHTIGDPKPLAPGEKIAVLSGRGGPAEILDYGALQKRLLKIMNGRKSPLKHLKSLYPALPPAAAGKGPGRPGAALDGFSRELLPPEQVIGNNVLAAFGWHRYDLSIRRRVAEDGREVIGSMGYTGPLAAFVPETLPNIADYFKEKVAVVTNPAIDRERESDHFTTRVILGCRPLLQGRKKNTIAGLELRNPLLLGGGSLDSILTPAESRKVADGFGTCLLEDVLEFFTCQGRDPSRVSLLDATFVPAQGLTAGLADLCSGAEKAVEKGAVLLVLDDSRSFRHQRVFIDPALAVASLDECLTRKGLRREASIVVRSAAIRNLHDLMFLLGIGADALNPYLLWRVSCDFREETGLPAQQLLINTMSVLQKGMEKVMSTMGIHELCGYGRLFASIGLMDELAGLLRMPNFCPSGTVGLGFGSLEKMAAERYALVNFGETREVFAESPRNPKVGKVLRRVATGKDGYLELMRELEKIEEELPTGLRHLLGVQVAPQEEWLNLEEVDISVGKHDLPLVIAAMSFGSQGENSFRAYAEAASKVNIVCMNGEGGEIPDMLGKYRRNRGQQIASGRFGVHMQFLNSTDFLEIKIGQGAKPGEGGHLPGNKVSSKVAEARHCKPGITLISPSNHHDIYSIEDLAQIITELKTASPAARVSVKIPITSEVGTISVGIAKAGADIINLSGYEGGTGAARQHAKRFVGLPAEIGVSEAHRALLESGLRDQVELWTDGGMRSGADVLKMVLLGANRVGFGTAALMGVGCISCERCHLDRCPRGICTQILSRQEAASLGVKGFTSRVVEAEAENLARLLAAIGDELRLRLARTGQRRLQDLVGRTDLLVQNRMLDRVDLGGILAKPAFYCAPEECARPRMVRKPLSYLTKLISDLAMARFNEGEAQVNFTEVGVRSTDRAIGTYLAGAMVRDSIARGLKEPDNRRADLKLESSVPGNGLCAFITPHITTVVHGGSQDGAAKGNSGGRLSVLKGRNLLGRRIDGSTGKSFAYGAIGGLLIVQNLCDSRACIRMSGADAIFGGRIVEPLKDELGNIASRAQLKGFAFEYMTGGRALVLGDPGPWICAGMTGGVIYQCLYPELGFDRQALMRRLAGAANVEIKAVSEKDLLDITWLLTQYLNELEKSFQGDEVKAVTEILEQAAKRFVMLVPRPLRPPSAE